MTGLLLVWTNIPPELERDFNEWYNREHMPERILGLAGFKRGRRFAAIEGGPRYLALYETHDVAALHSEPYLALKREFDAHSLRFVPNFRDAQKTAGEIVAHSGVAEGGVIAVVPIIRTHDGKTDLRDWIGETLVPDLLSKHGIVAAWYVESTKETLASVLADSPRKDRILDTVLTIEAMSKDALDAAVSALDWDGIRNHGGQPDAPSAQFRVIYTIHSQS